MSEFFTHLAGRALRPSDEVQPQIRSRFERGETVRQPGESNDFEEGEEGAISLIAPRERTLVREAASDKLAGRHRATRGNSAASDQSGSRTGPSCDTD